MKGAEYIIFLTHTHLCRMVAVMWFPQTYNLRYLSAAYTRRIIDLRYVVSIAEKPGENHIQATLYSNVQVGIFVLVCVH